MEFFIRCTWKMQLYFADPNARVADTAAQTRRFDVLLNGSVVLENVTVQPGSSVVQEIAATTADEQTLRLEFRALEGQPVISGIQLQRTSP